MTGQCWEHEATNYTIILLWTFRIYALWNAVLHTFSIGFHSQAHSNSMRAFLIAALACACAHGAGLLGGALTDRNMFDSLDLEVGKARCHYGWNASQESCCAHVSSTHIIKFDDEICLNATLHNASTVANTTVEVTLSDNAKVLFDKEYHIDKLGKECVHLEHKALDLCAEFKDVVLNQTAQALTACVDLELDLGKLKIASVKLGCFKLHM
jgi:hypothetical protein